MPMNRRVVSAVFDTQAEAERAISELRSAGITDRAISVVAQHDGKATTSHGTTDHHSHDGDKTRGGIGTGLTLGAVLGFGSLLIPGVGPFIAGGALAETLGVTGGAIAAGALTGGAVGGLAGALKDHGVSDEDSHYYEERIRSGGYFVSVDTSGAGVDDTVVSSILHGGGGHSASRPRTAHVI
jgi:hypothetical protein